MSTVRGFTQGVLPRGTTGVFMDPHEIGNVLGLDGIRWMMEESEEVPLKVWCTTSSCVPAAPGFEDTGAELTPETIRRAYELCDDEKMTGIRARVDALVEDPATAEALKPWYRQLCKRPCFHDEYLQAFNHSNTHLIDTDGRGVERIDADGAWVAGRHYPLDCLIFA
ncbi:MAG: hypothetical protein ACOC7L_02660, partial [Acidobacteriota bacterium]